MQPSLKKNKKIDVKKIRKYIILGLIIFILYLVEKKFFLMAFFVITIFIGKILRMRLGTDMIIIEPQQFYMILIYKYWGFKMLAIFLFITVIFGDAMASNLTDGSFLNYFLFHITPVLSNLLVGSFGMLAYGLVATLLYAFIYTPIKVLYLGGDPLQATSKALTPVIFTFLYTQFFGGMFALVM